jgi:hypothetical protein
MPISSIRGEKMRTNPFPFTKAAKLETQNGIRNNRNVCQNSNFTFAVPADTVLMYRANPMMALNPSDVSQRRRLESK